MGRSALTATLGFSLDQVDTFACSGMRVAFMFLSKYFVKARMHFDGIDAYDNCRSGIIMHCVPRGYFPVGGWQVLLYKLPSRPIPRCT